MTPTEHEKVNMREMNMKTSFFVPALIGALLVSLTSFTAFAQPEKNKHKDLQNGAKAYLLEAIGDRHNQDNIVIEVADIDDRIAIPSCPTDFQYHADSEALAQSYISVRVSCKQNDWYVFTNARVLRTRTIAVTAGMISPGTVLTSENLRLADIEINRLRHTAYNDIKPLIGARMKHRVRQGQPIQANMLCFVCEGDRITISAQLSGMQVKTAGIAQQDGVIGDNIEVLNASSRKSVIAEVASVQEVVVRL
ncbi:flagellar basal body P-ring formation chaperone FlgA [Alteromonas pelagimontana]|nr:flagellar basal body P-ring formation chaperone FlgA [Alteromonas pelagimontana]